MDLQQARVLVPEVLERYRLSEKVDGDVILALQLLNRIASEQAERIASLERRLQRGTGPVAIKKKH